jgi:hypothetical protein
MKQSTLLVLWTWNVVRSKRLQTYGLDYVILGYGAVWSGRKFSHVSEEPVESTINVEGIGMLEGLGTSEQSHISDFPVYILLSTLIYHFTIAILRLLRA